MDIKAIIQGRISTLHKEKTHLIVRIRQEMKQDAPNILPLSIAMHELTVAFLEQEATLTRIKELEEQREEKE